MKKLYTFLSLCLLVITGFAQTATYPNKVKYEILDADAKTAQVIRNTDNKPTGAITILDKVVINEEEYEVKTIEQIAFMDCIDLTSVVIPSSVTEIGLSAFIRCSNLKSVSIPNSVTSIGKSSFNQCTSLESVTLPNMLSFIGDYAFGQCENITSVVIPNTINSIGSNVFAACKKLNSVVIPSSVTEIGNAAFASCLGLTSITIPSNVNSIGDHAFFNCSALNSVTYLTESPSDISGKTAVFKDIDENAILTIPTDALTIFTTNGWGDYFVSDNISESSSLSNKTNTIEDLKLFTNNGDVKANLNNVSLEIYSVNGKKVANSNLKKGLYIVVAKNREGQMHTQKVLF